MKNDKPASWRDRLRPRHDVLLCDKTNRTWQAHQTIWQESIKGNFGSSLDDHRIPFLAHKRMTNRIFLVSRSGQDDHRPPR